MKMFKPYNIYKMNNYIMHNKMNEVHINKTIIDYLENLDKNIPNQIKFECSICFLEQSKISCIITECKHVFCRKCLKTWYLQSKLKNTICTCPLCRQKIIM